jgi:hypothetical protein
MIDLDNTKRYVATDRLIEDNFKISQSRHFKAQGLWYSFGNHWLNWCSENLEERYKSYKYLYEIDINDSVLKINPLDTFGFQKVYGNGLSEIKWEELEKKYSGFEVEKYQKFFQWELGLGIWWDAI